MSAQVVKTNQDSAFLKARISDLEAERASTALHLRRLEAQNTELRQLLDQGQPELICALEARDAALKKLHLMRELARDLLDERRVGRVRSSTYAHTIDTLGSRPCDPMPHDLSPANIQKLRLIAAIVRALSHGPASSFQTRCLPLARTTTTGQRS